MVIFLVDVKKLVPILFSLLALSVPTEKRNVRSSLSCPAIFPRTLIVLLPPGFTSPKCQKLLLQDGGGVELSNVKPKGYCADRPNF